MLQCTSPQDKLEEINCNARTAPRPAGEIERKAHVLCVKSRSAMVATGNCPHLSARLLWRLTAPAQLQLGAPEGTAAKCQGKADKRTSIIACKE